MPNLKFKILTFKNFISENESGLKSAKDKKRKAAKRVQELTDRANKNQMKYNYYTDKEKYEKKKIILTDKIKNEDNKIQKEQIRAELNKLKEEWKKIQVKYKNELKVK